MAPAAGLGQLAGVASQLKNLIDTGNQMEQVTGQLVEVLDQVEQARQAFLGLSDRAERTQYESDRQRFVTLRLVGTVNPTDPTDVPSLLALEEQYRAEYDAMRFLQALLHLVKKP